MTSVSKSSFLVIQNQTKLKEKKKNFPCNFLMNERNSSKQCTLMVVVVIFNSISKYKQDDRETDKSGHSWW